MRRLRLVRLSWRFYCGSGSEKSVQSTGPLNLSVMRRATRSGVVLYSFVAAPRSYYEYHKSLYVFKFISSVIVVSSVNDAVNAACIIGARP